MIRMGRRCPVCDRQDFHIHLNSEVEKALKAQKAQLKLW